jgi:hypothetical protein
MDVVESVIIGFRRIIALSVSISRAITLMMEAVCTSESSVHSNETTRHYIPEGTNLHYSPL